MYRHTAYVDQRVRQNAYTILNHESWHQRNILSAAPNASLGPSNITSDSIAVDEASLIPDFSPLNNATDSSSSNSAARLTDIPVLLQSTTALTKDAEADASWDNRTEAACVRAVTNLHGDASNASGLTACYNVRSYNNITGMFEADLRVYQIAAPSGKWTHLQAASETLDVVYTEAKIVKSSRVQKREITTVALPLWQEVKAMPLHKRRANYAPPTRLQGLSLLGKTDVLMKNSNG